MNKTVLPWLLLGVVVLIVVLALIWRSSGLAQMWQLMFDVQEEPASVAIVLANFKQYEKRRICFDGRVTNILPYPAASEDDPMSLIMDGIAGQLTMMTRDGASLHVWVLQQGADSSARLDFAAVRLDAAVRACGFPSLSPTINADEAESLLIIGDVSAPREQD